MQELNKDEGKYTYRFNDETQEFEIMLEDNEIHLQAVVFSLMMLDRVINDTSIPIRRRHDMNALLRWLRSKGANELADSFT